MLRCYKRVDFWAKITKEHVFFLHDLAGKGYSPIKLNFPKVKKESHFIMAKLGTENKPAIVRVQNEYRAQEVASIFDKNGWKFILGIEPDKPEDISDLEKLLNPPKPVQSLKIGRNDPCPCGSGKKYKKCCG
jgi:SWIM/SEC-C metal-binding protein